ncbi:hypothetical protein TIFTF001_036557 [Ficus carica]|uniref:Uncharacterized protein n=1 Tax=Ficus carica TaxID=3494 RepID=A0AA88E3Z8_FICCA|nr:hypothetical protein TIFTF001_036557 [Ficus carica]
MVETQMKSQTISVEFQLIHQTVAFFKQ